MKFLIFFLFWPVLACLGSGSIDKITSGFGIRKLILKLWENLGVRLKALDPPWIGCLALLMLIVPQVWGRVRAVPEDRHGAAAGGGWGGLRAQVQAHWGVWATGLPHSGTSTYSDTRCLVHRLRAQVQAHRGVRAPGLPHSGTYHVI